MKEAIRLTNKTAIALRRSAQKTRTASFAAAVILSILLGALGVYWGFRWLPAVPLMIVAIALMDCGMAVFARSRYLSLLGQAICTEAAAREIRAGRSESRRREQAIHDMMIAKADVQQMQAALSAAEEETAESAAPSAAHRRRRQSSLQLIRSEQAR